MYKSLRGQTTGKHETKTFDGRDYLVVPVVAMIEGVRLGANQDSGELGLASEFGKFVDGWNTSPVVLGHPQVDGEFVSAGSPDVLETYSLGLIFNTQLSGKKLKMQAWVDLASRDKSTEMSDLLDRLEAGDIVEVSVGFFTMVEEKNGKLNGQSYTGIWRDIVPDHLAILPEGTIGACSVEDGCGTRANQAKQQEQDMALGLTSKKAKEEKAKKAKDDKNAKKMTKGDCSCHSEEADESDAALSTLSVHTSENDESLTLQPNAIKALQHFIAQAVPTDMLSNDVTTNLQAALKEDHGWCWVVGYTATNVVYSCYDMDYNYKLYQRAFDMTDDGAVTFTSEPEEIRLISRIVPVNGSDSGNSDINVNSTNQEDTMSNTTKTETPSNATDSTLSKTETKTDKTAGEIENKGSETPAKSETALETPAKVDAGEQQNQSRKVLSTAEYIEQAPSEIREVLKSSMTVHQNAKNALITQIKGTGRNQFSDQFLATQSLDTLESLAKLADVPSYEGRAPGSPTVNTTDENAAPTAPKVFAKKTATA